MKTVRNLLILFIFAFALANVVNADGIQGKPKKAFNTTLDVVKHRPELVITMYSQIDRSFLDTVEELYIVKVIYNGAEYRILGSRQDWIRFFKMKMVFQPQRKFVKKIY